MLVASGLATFTSAYSLPNRLNATSIRLDQKITSKMSAFFRFSDTPSSNQSRRAFSIVTAFTSNTNTYTAGVTNQISSNLINSFRLGYGHNTMYHDGSLDLSGARRRSTSRVPSESADIRIRSPTSFCSSPERVLRRSSS